jgi:hypothetical protein
MLSVAVLCVIGYAAAQEAVWPSRARLVRAIDGEPGRVLEWMSTSLTEAQRDDFSGFMLGTPTVDERIMKLEEVKDLVAYYGDAKLAQDVGPALETKIEAERAKLEPEVVPVKEIAK